MKKEKLIMLIFAIVVGIILYACDSGSSSGTKWSDLSKQEQDNARWAYYAQEAAKNYGG